MSDPISTDQQQAILGAEVGRYVSDGWAVESVLGATATLTKNKRIGWFWNAILTLLTAGLWLIVVVYRVVNRKRYAIVLTVDPSGRVRRSNRGATRTSR